MGTAAQVGQAHGSAVADGLVRAPGSTAVGADGRDHLAVCRGAFASASRPHQQNLAVVHSGQPEGQDREFTEARYELVRGGMDDKSSSPVALEDVVFLPGEAFCFLWHKEYFISFPVI